MGDEPQLAVPQGTPNHDWSTALTEHDGWLRAVVRARIGGPQGVDEVLQEIAVATIENRAPLADPSKLGPWLYQVAVRQTLMYRRRQGRQRKLADRYIERHRPDQQDGHCPDPLDWLLARERDAQVRAGLARLPRRDMEILLLKYAHGWTYQRLAEHLGITHSAVEARLFRARRRLRHELTHLQVEV
jgi:RNA polymerase sigma-70 factor (ECF subfamily)